MEKIRKMLEDIKISNLQQLKQEGIIYYWKETNIQEKFLVTIH